jgi:autotransporter-associated beta strand protein
VLKVTGPINNSGFLLTIAGAGSTTLTGVLSGTGGLSMQGTGTLTLSAANAYSGGTTIVSGAIAATADAALGAGGTTTTVDVGATLGLAGGYFYITAENLVLNGAGVNGAGALKSSQGINSFAGPISLQSDATITSTGNGPLTITGALANNGFTLTVKSGSTTTITGVISGTGRLVEDTGTLVLTANNTYTGITTIRGTVEVDGSQPGSAVTVSTGGVLAGTGTVGVIRANGGTVSPGPVGGIGILHAASANFSDGGILDIQVPAYGIPGVNYDQLQLTGSLTLGGTSTMILDVNGLTSAGMASSIVTFAAASGTFSTVTLINNTSNLAASLTYNTTSIDAVFTGPVSPLLDENLMGPRKTGAWSSLHAQAVADFFLEFSYSE